MDPVSIVEAARRLGVFREEIINRIRKGELESRQMSTATGVGMGVVLPDDGSGPQETVPTGGQPLQPTPPPPQADGRMTTPPIQGWTGQPPTATPLPQPPIAQPSPAQPPPPTAQPPGPHQSPGAVTQTPAASPLEPLARTVLPPSVVEPWPTPPPQEPMIGTAQVESYPTATPPPPVPPQAEAPLIGEMIQPPRVEHQQRQSLLLEHDVEPPTPPPTPPRSSSLRELVGVLQHQVEVQREELQARRREVQELHVLLQQLQSRALPMPLEDTNEPQPTYRTTTPSGESPQPEAPEKKMSWWERLWRKD